MLASTDIVKNCSPNV